MMAQIYAGTRASVLARSKTVPWNDIKALWTQILLPAHVDLPGCLLDTGTDEMTQNDTEMRNQ